MKIKAVLFDLDGTLLPMNQEDFVKAYFGGIAKKLAPFGYEPKSLINAIYAGTNAMVANASDKQNEEVFWDTFVSILGEHTRKDEKYFDEFYQNEFDEVKFVCGFNQKAKEVVCQTKEMGFRVVLATNPIFPAIATQKRIKWAGLNEEDFEFYTTYENSNRCKPNLDYYNQIVKMLNLKAEECLMVGNDVEEDMVAEKLGMKVFLLSDCIINKCGKDLSTYPQGSFNNLIEFIKNINNE
ncbi:MAG: HAD family hydrolase [Clostridiales bacterium]|nr:HAD family hydrolase [Clostridiales bacterium]